MLGQEIACVLDSVFTIKHTTVLLTIELRSRLHPQRVRLLGEDWTVYVHHVPDLVGVVLGTLVLLHLLPELCSATGELGHVGTSCPHSVEPRPNDRWSTRVALDCCLQLCSHRVSIQFYHLSQVEVRVVVHEGLAEIAEATQD